MIDLYKTKRAIVSYAAAGSCFREFFALQRHEVLTEQGKKLPEAARRTLTLSLLHLN
jgi:hypothetical protein